LAGALAIEREAVPIVGAITGDQYTRQASATYIYVGTMLKSCGFFGLGIRRK